MSSVSEKVKRDAANGKPGTMIQVRAVCPACMAVQAHDHLVRGIEADGQVMACQTCGRSSHVTAFLVMAGQAGLDPAMRANLAEAIDVLNQLGSCQDLVRQLKPLLHGHA